MEDRGAPKQAASPAQEATRARIITLEAQLRKLKASGRLDQKANFQVRCLEEDLRKVWYFFSLFYLCECVLCHEGKRTCGTRFQYGLL